MAEVRGRGGGGEKERRTTLAGMAHGGAQRTHSAQRTAKRTGAKESCFYTIS